MSFSKSEFIVQAKKDNDWYDLINSTFLVRNRAIEEMNDFRQRELTDPNSRKFRVVHRITVEIYYENEIGVAHKWKEDEPNYEVN